MPGELMKKYLILFLALISIAAAPSRSNNYTSGTTIRASDVSANENAIFSYLQSGVDTYSPLSIANAAISASAAIGYSKLNLTGSIVNADVATAAAIAYSKLNLASSILSADILNGEIVNADVNASAAIVDTKLATISTAGKVSGAALTSLSSIPGAAGVIPAANLTSLVAVGEDAIDTVATSIATINTYVDITGWTFNITLPATSTVHITVSSFDFSGSGGEDVTYAVDRGGSIVGTMVITATAVTGRAYTFTDAALAAGAYTYKVKVQNTTGTNDTITSGLMQAISVPD